MSGVQKCGWCLTGHHAQCKGWSFDRTHRCGCRDTETCGGPEIPPPVREALPGPEKPLRAVSPRPGRACLCCGETTRGGKFLPGHDSRYLVRLAEQALTDPAGALAAAGEVSVAFQAKLAKRMPVPGLLDRMVREAIDKAVAYDA